MNLNDAVEGREYIIQAVDSGDEEVDAFLLSLGCYSGEPVTVISHLQGGGIIAVKDGRYTIDRELAETILI